MQYIMKGIIYLFSGIPIAILVYAFILIILWVSRKRKNTKYLRMVKEYFFVLYTVAILKITGIIGMQFNISWFRNSLRSIGVSIPFANGSIMMFAFNLIVFVPWGFLLPLVIRRKKWNFIKILLVGIIFSSLIEFLQMFGGRMSELDDIIMNSLGTLLGYWLFKICEYTRRNKTVINEMNNLI